MFINSVIKSIGRTGRTQKATAGVNAFVHAEDMQMKTCRDHPDRERQVRDQADFS